MICQLILGSWDELSWILNNKLLKNVVILVISLIFLLFIEIYKQHCIDHICIFSVEPVWWRLLVVNHHHHHCHEWVNSLVLNPMAIRLPRCQILVFRLTVLFNQLTQSLPGLLEFLHQRQVTKPCVSNSLSCWFLLALKDSVYLNVLFLFLFFLLTVLFHICNNIGFLLFLFVKKGWSVKQIYRKRNRGWWKVRRCRLSLIKFRRI